VAVCFGENGLAYCTFGNELRARISLGKSLRLVRDREEPMMIARAATMDCASVRFIAVGFSHRTCLPA